MKVRVSYTKPQKTANEAADKLAQVAENFQTSCKGKYISGAQLRTMAEKLKEWANGI